jgi:hypothetical protein
MGKMNINNKDNSCVKEIKLKVKVSETNAADEDCLLGRCAS